MALVKAGWWHTTWWPSSWWHEDWWLEYGTAVAPAPAAPTPGGGVFRHRRGRPRRVVKTTLELFRDYLEFKVKQHD